ncbi:hypothetical protein SUGI_0687540 [Cryptomeria japonica]|uniref:uncharacterized protein LOC131056705 n=1 Tax=Cryptomeria japonica TaxID=3369 RepID=UPI0024148BC0|nr:uncharacterized protein LOC131056705 [Cryptomeria japonica]GLJ34208.1 hypothetical protein SUGI_0687540 [Cryptomeria japonica]
MVRRFVRDRREELQGRRLTLPSIIRRFERDRREELQRRRLISASFIRRLERERIEELQRRGLILPSFIRRFERDLERREELQRTRLILPSFIIYIMVRRSERDLEQREELQRRTQIMRLREVLILDELPRRSMHIREEVTPALNSVSTTENDFLQTPQPEVASQQMKREATELIGALDTIKISTSQMEEAPRCVICMNDFMVGEDGCVLSCHKTHIFHHDCLRQWLECKKCCPLCKTAVPYPYQ